MNDYQHSSNTCTHFSWSAVFGGIVSSIGVGVLLSLLGICLGLAFFEVDADTMTNISIGSVVWFLIGGTIAMFVCGWVTGHLAVTQCTLKGCLHGLVAWGLSTILGLIFVASGAGAVVTGASELIGKTIDTAGKTASYVIPNATQMAKDVASIQNDQIKQMTQQLKDLLQQAQKKAGDQAVNALLNPPAKAQDDIIKAVKNYLTNTDESKGQELKEAVIDQLTNNTDITHDQAEQVINQWQQAYQKATEKAQQIAQQAKDKATEMAEQASDVLSAAALSAFITLVIGAIAAITGAGLATRRRCKYHSQI